MLVQRDAPAAYVPTTFCSPGGSHWPVLTRRVRDGGAHRDAEQREYGEHEGHDESSTTRAAAAPTDGVDTARARYNCSCSSRRSTTEVAWAPTAECLLHMRISRSAAERGAPSGALAAHAQCEIRRAQRCLQSVLVFGDAVRPIRPTSPPFSYLLSLYSHSVDKIFFSRLKKSQNDGKIETLFKCNVPCTSTLSPG